MPIIEHSSYRAPIFLGNAHLQTIIPSYLRKEVHVNYEIENHQTPDGDFIQFDWSRRGSDKLLVICHGLCGHTQRHYVLSLVKAFNAIGWDCLAWHYRGTSDVLNNQPGYTTNDSSHELAWVVQEAIKCGHYRKVGLSGYSMGGNLVALYLGREANEIPPEVIGGASFCATIDLVECSLRLNAPFTRIYAQHFLGKLMRMIQQKHERFPDIIDQSYFSLVKSFYDFDTYFTAPLNGYKSAEDYWETGSAYKYLHQLTRPLLIVNPQNDPFLAGQCYPLETARNSDKLFLEMPKSGGHCGFITADINKEWWPAKRAKDFLSALI